ncbi:hypothetical protein F5B17DRAFT_30707 [Nemania serpens]|nr:hypothetical protein F5B17DRAFT_30707 [Nemania serpens]
MILLLSHDVFVVINHAAVWPPAEEKGVAWVQRAHQALIYGGKHAARSTCSRAEKGINITDNQLEYQLKKWKFRKNINKSTWISIDRHLAKRNREGKKSEVIHCGQRVNLSKVVKETERYRDVTVFARLAPPHRLYELIRKSLSAPHRHSGWNLSGHPLSRG